MKPGALEDLLYFSPTSLSANGELLEINKRRIKADPRFRQAYKDFRRSQKAA